MHGQVWEWCVDWCGPYPSGDVKDPRGEKSGDARFLGRRVYGYYPGEARVQRGGCWNLPPGYCRSANRGWVEAAERHRYYGCRVILGPD
jgi:formylglycine-generating enzyme required for sulfatase activity